MANSDKIHTIVTHLNINTVSICQRLYDHSPRQRIGYKTTSTDFLITKEYLQASKAENGKELHVKNEKKTN